MYDFVIIGGGIIGMSRGKRQHAAGLRTHRHVDRHATD